MPCLSYVVINVLHDLSIRQCDNCSNYKLVLGYECLSGVCVWRLLP